MGIYLYADRGLSSLNLDLTACSLCHIQAQEGRDLRRKCTMLCPARHPSSQTHTQTYTMSCAQTYMHECAHKNTHILYAHKLWTSDFLSQRQTDRDTGLLAQANLSKPVAWQEKSLESGSLMCPLALITCSTRLRGGNTLKSPISGKLLTALCWDTLINIPPGLALKDAVEPE